MVRRHPFAALLVGVLAWPLETAWALQPSAPSPRRLEIVNDLALEYPPNWQVAETVQRGVKRLVSREPSGRAAGEELQNQVVITNEPRLDAADARTRLEAIAAEVPSAPPQFLLISGWPALQRRYAVPLEQTGQAQSNETEPESTLRAPAERPLSERVTTAVAWGETLVRMEGMFAPGASKERVAEVEAMGRALRAPAPPASERASIQRFLGEMRARFRAAPSPKPSPKERAPAAPAPAEREAPEAPPSGTAPGAGVLVPGQSGELEVAVSTNGQNVVVATNSGFAFSTNGGLSFTGGGGIPAGFPRDGDPSLAVGASGNFYLGFIGFPNGTPAAGNVTGCATSVDVSSNAGQTFNFVGHAVVCPNGQNACFPDQEHIAADRVNAAATGDQVYSVWRNFLPSNPGPNVNCRFGSGFVTPSLVCSTNSGQAWGQAVALGSGDFPRVAVGRDGFVYVAFRQGGNVMLDKFSSCAAGLVRQQGFPVTVASSVTGVPCPVPGLDRCNDGNVLSSQTVAPDDLAPSHVYVAYASSSGAGNENIVVHESNNGGLNFPRQATANAGGPGRRFLPWTCATGGAAFVSWYDRRTASKPLPSDPACLARCEAQRDLCREDFPPRVCTPPFERCKRRCGRQTSDDLTEYYQAMVRPVGSVLQAANETNLSGAGRADPQCASGWSCAPRAIADSESCSVQPQLAGVCCNAALPNCPGSRQACDFSSGGCPAGETCNTGGGCPKYGDYNGGACVGGRGFFAWASATTPAGAPAGAGIRVFHASTPPAATLTVRKVLSPPSDAGRFGLTIDGVLVVGNAGNNATSGPRVLVPGSHVVGERPGLGTNILNYTTSFGGDCSEGGGIILSPGDDKTCTIRNERIPRAQCLQQCKEFHTDCLQSTHEPGGPTIAQCATAFAACKAQCN